MNVQVFCHVFLLHRKGKKNPHGLEAELPRGVQRTKQESRVLVRVRLLSKVCVTGIFKKSTALALWKESKTGG